MKTTMNSPLHESAQQVLASGVNSPASPANSASKDQSFRFTLRTASRAHHDQAEATFQPFRDAPAENLDWFLTAQLLGFCSLREQRAGEACEAMDQAIDALMQDCKDRPLNRPLPIAPRKLHPLAVDYIFYGSRLGTKVLARQLTEAGITPLPAYFQMVDQGGWAACCARLEMVDRNSRLADKLIDDVGAGFAIFQAAAGQATELLKAQA